MEILNRTWRGRVPSDWSEPVSYQISERPAPPLVYNIQVRPLRSEAATLAELIFPVRGRPRTIEASQGDVIVLEGDFFANRADELRVVLACGAARSSLRPVSADSLQWVSVSIPRAAEGVCELTVMNVNSRTKSTLPISLRIRR